MPLPKWELHGHVGSSPKWRGAGDVGLVGTNTNILLHCFISLNYVIPNFSFLSPQDKNVQTKEIGRKVNKKKDTEACEGN